MSLKRLSFSVSMILLRVGALLLAAIVDDKTLIILVTLSQDTVETSCHRLRTIEMRDNNADQGHRAMRFRSSPFHWDAVNLCPC